MNFIPLLFLGEGRGFRLENGESIRCEAMEKLAMQRGVRECILGIRPEFLSIAASGEIRGSVVSIEPLGYKNLYAVEIAPGRIIRVEDMRRERFSGNVSLAVRWEAACLFDPKTGQSIR
jgi:ABC-type sugar transport system ATPase subunit